MKQTIAEKIISRHASKSVKAGDVVIVRVDGVMATDATAPFAIQALRKMGGKKLWDSAHVVFLAVSQTGRFVYRPTSYLVEGVSLLRYPAQCQTAL